MLDICCKNLSNKLSDLFSSYIKESSKIVYSHGGYNWWDEYDGYDSYDGWYGDEWNDSFSARDFTNVRSINHSCHNDDEDYYPSYRQKSFKKSSKRGNRGGKKHKGVTVYDSDSLDYDLPFTSDNDSTIESDITIHFYDDILNPDSKRTFNSLYDFEEFLDSENIYVSSTDQASLLRNKINHCCKDPNFSSSSNPWLITDPTYGGLRWLCAANDEDIYYE